MYLTVLDPARRDFKDSAREFLDYADAVLILEPGLDHPAWERIALDVIRSKPIFSISPERYVPPEVAVFVEERLASTMSAVPILT